MLSSSRPSQAELSSGGAGDGRRVVRAILRILWLLFAIVYLPRIPRSLLRKRRPVMPMGPRERAPGDPRRVGMANLMSPASLTMEGIVQAVNKGGLKVNERWFNYPRPYTGTKVSPDVVGTLVALAFMEVEGKAFLTTLAVKTPAAAALVAAPAEPVLAPSSPVAPPAAAPRSIAEIVPPEPAQEATAPASQERSASERQLQEIARVSELAKVSSPRLSLILKMRWNDEGKALKSLTAEEASRLIYFLGGSLPRKSFGRERR